MGRLWARAVVRIGLGGGGVEDSGENGEAVAVLRVRGTVEASLTARAVEEQARLAIEVVLVQRRTDDLGAVLPSLGVGQDAEPVREERGFSECKDVEGVVIRHGARAVDEGVVAPVCSAGAAFFEKVG